MENIQSMINRFGLNFVIRWSYTLSLKLWKSVMGWLNGKKFWFKNLKRGVGTG